MNNNLRYLALALLLTTNVAVAEDTPTSPKATTESTTAAAPKVTAPKATTEPKKSEAKSEETPEDDWVATFDARYIAFKDTAKEVFNWGKGVVQGDDNKTVRHTELRKDLTDAKDDFFTSGHVNKTNALAKARERDVKGLTAKVEQAIIDDAKETTESSTATVEKLKADLAKAKELLKEEQALAEEAKAERAIFEARIAARAAADAKKVLDADEKALAKVEKTVSKLKELSNPSNAIKNEIKIEAAKIAPLKAKVKEAKAANDKAQKAKAEANKKADIKATTDSSDDSGFFAGVATFVQAHPVAVAVGGTAATVVAVVALYKWNKAAHQAATLEEELAELEMTNVNA